MTGTYDSASAYDLATVTFDGGAAGDLTNLPVLGVFIAFDNDPYDADPDWEEITSYVRDVSISRGRNDDYSQFPAGTASLTLNNRNRVFDPFNTSSPYAGKLLPRKQIKIVAQANGSNYTIFRGYCAGFPVKFINNGADSTITLDCFDAFGLIAATELPIDWSFPTISALNPVGYYRCDDPAGSTTVVDRGSKGLNATLNSPDAPNAQKDDSLAKGLPFGAMNAQIEPFGLANVRTTEERISLDLTDVIYNGMTFAGFVKSNNNGFNASRPCLRFECHMFNLEAEVYAVVNTVTQQIDLYFYGVVQTGIRTFAVKIFIFPDVISVTESFHFAITVNRDPFDVKCYLNGREIVVAALNTTYTNRVPSYLFRYEFAMGQELFNIDRVLTAQEIADVYLAGVAQFYESTADRAARLLALTGMPEELIDITDLPVGTVSSIPNSGFVLPVLQRTADSEGGEVFTSRDGVITFVNRYNALTNGSAAAFKVPFGEQSGGQPFSDQLEIMYDADSIRNEVAVQFADGGQVSASSPSSIAAYGRSDETISTDLASIADAQSLATLEATVSSVLEPTISPIQIGTTRSASQWANILNMDLLDQYSVSYTPSTGSAFSQNLLLNRITYDITPSAWQVTIAGSSRLCGWFCADVSLTNGSDVVL